MSRDDEPKDPVLEKLREAGGNYADVAKEIAKGVVEYDRAKKRSPDGAPVHDPALFRNVSDTPMRNKELGIPFRTDPGSPSEAAAQEAQKTAEELGILPEPKPFTVPPREPPVRARREAETVPVSRDPVPAAEPRSRLWVVVAAALVTGLGIVALLRVTRTESVGADAGAVATPSASVAASPSVTVSPSAEMPAPPASSTVAVIAPASAGSTPHASPVKCGVRPAPAGSSGVVGVGPTEPPHAVAASAPKPVPAAPSASSRFGQFMEEEKQK